MGGSIARGLAKGTIIPANDIIVSNPTQSKLDVLKAEFPALQTTRDNQEAVTGAELIILAVKPWLMKSVVSELKLKSKQILISVAAGIPFEELAHYVADKEMTMFRLIPNTANQRDGEHDAYLQPECKQRTGTTAARHLQPDGTCHADSRGENSGRTAMTSCGIAYVLKYIQAAMQAGIEMGIYPKDGMRMIAQSVKGAAELILNNDTHPSVEIDKVCTPGGITIKGINELEHRGFSSAIINAIKASK